MTTKRALTKQEAKRLYAQEFYTYKEIAGQLHISERTVYAWAKAEGWDRERQETLSKAEGLLKDRMDIAKLLGARIISELRQGKEPSAAALNAYRGITENLSKLKDFEDSGAAKEEGHKDLSERTKQLISNTFNADV